MAKAGFYNKGLLKGTLTKGEIVKGEKNGKKYEFFSGSVKDNKNNKVNFTMFPTQTNPNKHTEAHEEFKVGSKVQATGGVNEKEFTSASGRKGLERSVSANSIKALPSDAKEGCVFILGGNVVKKKEVSDGFEVEIVVIEKYTPKSGANAGVEQTKELSYTLFANDEELIEDLNKGDNAKFKGQIINQLEFDDYGDIVGDTQMFLLEKVENLIPADEIEAEEEAPDFL